jgi:cob(I)alamin adenosyltransferase
MISTKQGDGGFTGLPGAAAAVRKDDPRIECLGALDELDAFLALCENLAQKADGVSRIADIITCVRRELFDTAMPAVIALNAGGELPRTGRLEQWIAELEREYPVRGFIRDWGKASSACSGSAAAYLNIARTICRRAERRMVSFAVPPGTGPGTADEREHAAYMPLLAWINRLSDLLFLLAAAEQ